MSSILKTTSTYRNRWMPPGVYNTTYKTTGLGIPNHNQVIHGDSKYGYPGLLGKADLTTNLFGEGGIRLTRPVGSVTIREMGYSKEDHQTTGELDPLANFSTMFNFTRDLDTLEICATKLRSKIYSAQAGTQSGVFLGELKQTLRLLKQPVKTIAKALSKLDDVPGHIKGLGIKRYSKQFLTRWSDAYLEFSFGMQPLASDIKKTIERVSQILEKQLVQQVSVKSIQDKLIEPVTYSQGSMPGFTYWVFRNRSTEEQSTGRALVKTLPHGPNFHPGNFGFRFEDFVPTMYELIPWSFLIDYFTNLNELVNATFYEQTSVIFGYVTQERKKICRVEYRSFKPLSAQYSYADGASSPLIAMQRDVVRQPLGLIPDSFSLSVPGIRQLVNIAALTTSTLNLR